VLDLGAKEGLFRSGVIFHWTLVIIKDVSRRYALQIGRKPFEKRADVVRAHFCSASPDVGWPLQLDFVAPTLLEASDPVLPWPAVGPSGFNIILDAVGLHNVLQKDAFVLKGLLHDIFQRTVC
jgi:hypothetical protein